MFFYGKNKTKFFLAILPIICCVIWQFIAGKDLNWDANNYHLYAGFSAINDRFSQDFFAAGPQSYLNPYAYTLFYLLVTYSSNALLVGLLLAISQSAVIYLTWGIAKSVLKQTAPSTSFLILTTILSVSTTVVWHQIGSSFIDIYVTIFVLAGVYSLLKYDVSPTATRAFLSAFVLGFAVGIKLTSGMFALAGACCALYLMCIKHKKYKHFIWFSVAGVVGALLVEGWWAYRVFQETGNPFFPFFNSVFCSPYTICESIKHHRFIPSSLSEALVLPFEMLLPSPWLYIELLSPDARFAFLFIAIPIFVYLQRRSKDVATPFKVVIGFWLICYFIWLYATANGRYGMPLFILVGIIIGYIIAKSLNAKRAQIYMLLLVTFQAFLLVFGGGLRWNSQEWTSPYFEYQLPEKLTNSPALYISATRQSNSFLIPQYHPDSSFINVSGQMPLDGKSALGKIEQLSKLHNGRVRFFAEVEVLEGKQIADVNWPQNFNSKIERFGWKIVKDQCEYVENNVNKGTIGLRYIADCPIEEDAALATRFQRSVVEIDTIFSNIEKHCPQLFSPSTGVTEKFGGAWSREYIGTDTSIFITDISVIKVTSNEVEATVLGTREEWSKNPTSAAKGCFTNGQKRSKSMTFDL